jgi:hypothetical protein
MHQNWEALGSTALVFFQVLVRLVAKNCKARISESLPSQEGCEEEIGEVADKEEGEKMELNADDEDDDLWDEEYYQNNASLITKVNELAYFRQTMETLSKQVP